MKTLFSSFIMILFLLNHNLRAQDCNCEVALRYDIYTSTNTELSEYAYVKSVGEEVRRNSRSSTNIAGSIKDALTLKFGREKAEQLIKKYSDFTSVEQNIKTLDTYYIAKTSSPSYEAFKQCLNICGNSSTFNVNYTTTLNRANFSVFYNGNNAIDETLKVSYSYEKDGKRITKSKKLKRGNLEFISIIRPTLTQSFSVTFIASRLGRDGEKSFTITPAVLGELTVKETNSSDVPAEPIYYQIVTDNNNNKGFKVAAGYKLDSAGKSDGVHREFSRSVGGKPIRATEVLIVATATMGEGYYFTDARVYPVSGPAGGWNNKRGSLGDGFLRKDKDKIVYQAKYWSKPVTLDFYAYRRKLNNIEVTTHYVLQPDNQLTFLTKYDTALISYSLGGASPKHLIMGREDDRLKFVRRESDGNNTVFNYRYTPLNNQ